LRDVVNIALRKSTTLEFESLLCIARGRDGRSFFTIDTPKHGRWRSKVPGDTAIA
jgi:hypothetical protein